MEGSIEYNPVALFLLQMEKGRWPPFLLASCSALQREIWGVEGPAAPATDASEDAVGKGLGPGPGNVDHAEYLLRTTVCAVWDSWCHWSLLAFMSVGALWKIPSIMSQKTAIISRAAL